MQYIDHLQVPEIQETDANRVAFLQKESNEQVWIATDL